jgi:hypothetical protein
MNKKLEGLATAFILLTSLKRLLHDVNLSDQVTETSSKKFVSLETAFTLLTSHEKPRRDVQILVCTITMRQWYEGLTTAFIPQEAAMMT